MNFRLEILAKIFRNDAGSSQFAQIHHGQLREITKHNGERRGGVADESEAHVVMLRPFAVIGDRENNDLGQFIVPEDFQNLGFREAGIVEGDFENLGVAGGDQGPCDTGGAATGEGNSLAQGQLGETRDDVFLGVALEFGGNRGRQRKLHEVHEVEITQEAETNEARSIGMKNQRALYGVALQKVFSRGDVFDDLLGQIFPGEQQAEERIVERGISEQRGEDLGRWVIEQRLEFFAGGEASAVALLFEKGQVRFLTRAAEAEAPDARQPPRDSIAAR
jgi:hypothetical protein